VLNFRVSFPEHVGVNWVDLANRCKNKFTSSDVTVASEMTSPHTHRPLQWRVSDDRDFTVADGLVSTHTN